ncbi:PSD1 and planctomycete cytochrome C domain-containing protein [Novipirellula caenicola]
MPDEIDFNEHVRPIFNSHCTACHGGVKQAGDVSFVYREQVLPPDGWIVEPGDPENSVLIERVITTDPDFRMPPPDHGPPLSSDEVAVLTKWIEQGAVWRASYWSYAAPEPQPLPEVSNPAWERQPLDRFVLAKLDEKGLKPSPDAAPERWLRRVTLDLTGLPPTLEQRDAFLAAFSRNNDAARREYVDQLLASTAFGERWASVWLDQIRYADSKGLGLDGRRSVWKYRDWVIDSLNRDLPYDQFTIKQIAGDLLPEPTIEDLIATAAHRLTQNNEEGGTDDEEFRVAAVLDRVSTTWQAWLGVTFGCVQCHSHPYDPFRHEEFYEFAAFFNNTADSDLDEDWPVIQAPIDPRDNPRADQLDRQIRSLCDQLFQREFSQLKAEGMWTPLVEMKASTNNATQIEVEKVDDHDEFHTVDTVSRNTDITLETPLPPEMKQLTAIRVTVRPLDPKSGLDDSEWGFVLSELKAAFIVEGQESPTEISFARVISDDPNPFYDPNASLDAKSNRGFAAYSRIHHSREAAFVLDSPIQVPENARLRVTLKHRVFVLGAFSLIARRGHLAVSDSEEFTKMVNDESLAKLRDELTKLEKERSRIKSVSVPVMQERPAHLARPSHLFERGLFLTKGKQVTPSTPESLHPLPRQDTDDSLLPPNRLTLAKWLVSQDNPLTARVAVNRVWAQLFGTGLVLSEEDFGSSGESPSHPELLDYLALRFQNEQQWSMKTMIREIVLSRTYGQSAKVTDEGLQLDPQNQWLSRGPRHRLSSEIVRDQALALSGLLSDKSFGPPVHPPIPDGVWKPFQSGDKWTPSKPGDEERYRRSIYTYMKRSIPYPMFAAFDSPSREFCSPRRLRSNTPLQALMMLNDETFAESAAALAARMQAAKNEPREQIRYGFLIVTSREPSSADLDDLMTLFNSQRNGSEADLKRADADAMTTVAAVLLNLDEVVMK